MGVYRQSSVVCGESTRVYGSLVQSREDYRQSTEILCSLWAVYRQSRVL